ncbi:MFS transporter [Aestuariivirga litoralis]|uniref:MFS transporter n=1 Tax=Aestuariivirga litoralis TaxID=2650924 RepID=A0A2W2BC89_9HYPH|nr:MFS transporter [Aestuariivirga litoralis]PZF77788.1 MFS transporter [Aestuariivirga litoralis]
MTRLRLILSALLPFAIGYFMSYLLRAVNAVVAPDLVKDLGLTPAQLGLLTAAYLGAFALFQLPLGVLLDRYGPRKVQAALLTVAAAGCLGFAFAPNFLVLFIARAVVGLGFSAGLMASYKSTAMWVPVERRSLANTAVMSVGALGMVVASEPTEYLVGLIGWRGAFAVFAGVILVSAVLVFAAAPRADTFVEPSPLRRQFGQMLAILKTPVFWRLAPLLGLTSGVQIGISTLWTGPWFRDVMGHSREEVARHLLYLAVAFMVGILSVGVVADRLGRRGISPMQVMLGANLFYFAAQIIIVLRITSLALPAWLVVGALGQVAVLAYPWFEAHLGRDVAGRANAAINFTLFVCAFVSQYLVGFIIGLFPASATGYSAQGYSWAIGVFLLAQFVAYGWYLAASPHKERSA